MAWHLSRFEPPLGVSLNQLSFYNIHPFYLTCLYKVVDEAIKQSIDSYKGISRQGVSKTPLTARCTARCSRHPIRIRILERYSRNRESTIETLRLILEQLACSHQAQMK